MEILEATLDDVPAAARMISRAEPDRVFSPEAMLHFVRSVPERAQRRLWKAVAGGELAAWAAVGLNWESETEGDAYAVADVPELPGSLESAIRAFREDDVLRKALGETFSDYFVTSREWELKAWRDTVTDWERARYDRSV